MSAKVLIGNLPPKTTEAEVKGLFNLDDPSTILHVQMNTEGDPDRVSAVVELNMDKTTAKIMSERVGTKTWKGRTLEIYVPTLFD